MPSLRSFTDEDPRPEYLHRYEVRVRHAKTFSVSERQIEILGESGQKSLILFWKFPAIYSEDPGALFHLGASFTSFGDTATISGFEAEYEIDGAKAHSHSWYGDDLNTISFDGGMRLESKAHGAARRVTFQPVAGSVIVRNAWRDSDAAKNVVCFAEVVEPFQLAFEMLCVGLAVAHSTLAHHVSGAGPDY